MRTTWIGYLFTGILILAAAACSGSDAVRVNGISGWKPIGATEHYNKEGLYGYIDGGAEIVLQYGFRKLSVQRFAPAAAGAPGKEITLEIYRMASGQAAFGLYSTKLEGGEKPWPGLRPGNWAGPGQANLVKGEYLVNVLAPDCDEREIGGFLAAVEPKVPGRETAHPKGLDRLPPEGMIPSSERYLKGPLAARNESPFLEGDFWGFAPASDGKDSTVAYSAKYGSVPEVSKLVVVELGPQVDAEAVDAGVLSAFREYLRDVKREGPRIQGYNDINRVFLYSRAGRKAALVLGEADDGQADARVARVLGAPAEPRPEPSTPGPKTSLVVTFDTEDYISPESEHIDDIPKWLAETMSEEGVTGTFFVIGEKARSLEKRGRRDVIAAMAKHDIGSHTNFGSIHPTVTEELEKAGWDDGIRLMAGQESAGIRELERIFGVPVKTLARHGGSYGPQLVAALGRLGAGYQGSPVSLPGHDVVWFCNALNFSAQYAGFDDTFYRDDLFEPVFDKLKKDWPATIRTSQVLALFAGHPTKIRAEEFWDLNFYGGKNTPPGEWRAPRLRPQETMANARKNFRRLMRWIAGRDDIEITTYRRLMEDYGRQKETMTRAELADIARRTLAAGSLAPTDDFSPAEAFAGMAQALAGSARPGTHEDAKTVHPFGPLETPPATPEVGQARLEDVRALARSAAEHIARTGALPAILRIGDARIGAGSLFALFSAAYLDLDAGRARPTYDVPAFEPYPRTNEEKIIGEVRGYKTWPVHKPDLDMSRLVEFTKLQLWTLKPARFSPPAN